MGYVIAGFIVLLLIIGFAAFLWLNASRRSTEGAAHDPTAPTSGRGGPAGIGPDHTPLGDTAEHAGEQTAGGETVRGQDAERSGEGERAAEDDRERRDPPASERLANRRP